MVSVVFYQFGLGLFAFILRFGDWPVRKCIARCKVCFVRCYNCLCCKVASTPSAEDSLIEGSQSREVKLVQRSCLGRFVCGLIMVILAPIVFCVSRLRIRWYWFHLAMQVGFLSREFVIISQLDGWDVQMAVAHGSIWFCVLIVLWECWRFSKVRISLRTAAAVDEVLDMVLLPVNYGFVCSLCVRILKLQPDHQNRTLVSAVMESADIWEAWALWSVLELFVRVVEVTSSRDKRRQGDTEYLEAVKAFKSLSLQGVKSWVFILTLTIMVNVFMKGIVGVLAPTLCFSMTKSCHSCEDWYVSNVETAAESVLFILCSFALVFVFTFERVFSEALHDIQPFWKFWGVKGVVSVTYFQWLVIKYGLSYDETHLYLLHTFLCCVEMPLLAILHATCAYPYGKPWLKVLLETAIRSRDAARQRWLVRSTSQRRLSTIITSSVDAAALDTEEAQLPRDPDAIAAQEALEEEEDRDLSEQELQEKEQEELRQEEDEERERAGDSMHSAVSRATASHAVLGASMQLEAQAPGPSSFTAPLREDQGVGAAGFVSDTICMQGPLQGLEMQKYDDCCSTVFYLILWVFICIGSVQFIQYLVPAEFDIKESQPVYELTCNNEAFLDAYVREMVQHQHLHWELTEDVQDKFKRGVPMCSVATLACQYGYYGAPNISCTPEGNYSHTGTCVPSECGPPPVLPHASVNWGGSDVKWGMKVRYDCNTGFVGSPVATCGKTVIGEYAVEGHCEEVVCSALPGIPNAQPLVNSSADRFRLGTTVHYQCDEGHLPDPEEGPSAHCGDGGLYSVRGICKTECGPPPDLDFAVPEYDQEVGRRGFTAGTKIDYICGVGHGGNVSAICEDDGNYTVRGKCVIICAPPLGLAHAKVLLDGDTLAHHPWSVGERVAYRCDPGFKGRPLSQCQEDGQWTFDVSSGTDCNYEGCPPVADFLTSAVGPEWREEMREQEVLNITPDGRGDVRMFACLPGRLGQPMASCQQGNWSIRGSCAPSTTAAGCKCKVEWPLCDGWMQSNCQAWYGCNVRASEPYGWCQVDPDSCPESSEDSFGQKPTWDYCVDGPHEVTWTPEPVDSPGLPQRTKVALGASLLALTACVAMVTRRFSTRRSTQSSQREVGGRIETARSGRTSDSDAARSGTNAPAEHVEEQALNGPAGISPRTSP